MRDCINVCAAVVDEDGVLAAAVSGTPDYCAQVFRASLQACPYGYVQKILHGDVRVFLIQRVESDIVVFEKEASALSFAFSEFINLSVLDLVERICDFFCVKWEDLYEEELKNAGEDESLESVSE